MAKTPNTDTSSTPASEPTPATAVAATTMVAPSAPAAMSTTATPTATTIATPQPQPQPARSAPAVPPPAKGPDPALLERIAVLEKRIAGLENDVHDLLSMVTDLGKTSPPAAAKLLSIGEPDARKTDYEPVSGAVRARVSPKGSVKIHKKTFAPGEIVFVPPEMIEALDKSGLVQSPDLPVDVDPVLPIDDDRDS